MKFSAFLITTALALATARPSPAETASAAIQDVEADGEVGILASKHWQAAGGCKRGWNSNTCLRACTNEADAGRCTTPGRKVTISISDDGCFWGWETCECYFYSGMDTF
ncbi:hypothetical protein B0T21DRAFT_348301 [Apiosordaria backusii]|uniref:Invertebrate defensins family profile domain-containing protein n=1 Tax=Apiosordaria backusii TaxID=314023 RepID=A0AA40BL37_9PEZI|nr:hypothetical protein B0T21DRAFT_348301 [Apiosordaria backusii]